MIQAQLSDKEILMVDALVSTGLWGQTREECVERLVAYALLDLTDVMPLTAVRG